MKTFAKCTGQLSLPEYLFTLEEVWWMREHPFDIRCVKARRLAEKVASLEMQLEASQKELDEAVTKMNEARGKNDRQGEPL